MRPPLLQVYWFSVFAIACGPGTIHGGTDGSTSVDGSDAAHAIDARDSASSTTDVLRDTQSNDTGLVDAGPPDTGDPCAARPCPQWQRCIRMGAGTQCVDPCTGITCSPPEMCFASDVNGQPLAMDMYGSPLGVCLDPCATVTCPSNQTCVPGAHGAPLGACVDRCDCRNCGNCDAGGTFVGQQAYCGNPSGMPATMACTTPCSGGEGCIPWDSQGGICWPLEGCFSL